MAGFGTASSRDGQLGVMMCRRLLQSSGFLYRQRAGRIDVCIANKAGTTSDCDLMLQSNAGRFAMATWIATWRS
jgi:hypothetical protein